MDSTPHGPPLRGCLEVGLPLEFSLQVLTRPPPPPPVLPEVHLTLFAFPFEIDLLLSELGVGEVGPRSGSLARAPHASCGRGSRATLGARGSGPSLSAPWIWARPDPYLGQQRGSSWLPSRAPVAPLPCRAGRRGGLPGVGQGLLPRASSRSAGGVDGGDLSRFWGIFFHLVPWSRLPNDGWEEAAPFAPLWWAGGLVGWRAGGQGFERLGPASLTRVPGKGSAVPALGRPWIPGTFSDRPVFYSKLNF